MLPLLLPMCKRSITLTHERVQCAQCSLENEKKYIKFLCIFLSVILLRCSIQNRLKLFTVCAIRIKCEWKERRRLRSVTNRREFEWLLCAMCIQWTKRMKKKLAIIFALWHGFRMFHPLFSFRFFVKFPHTLVKYIFFNSRFNWHLKCDGKSEISFSV